MPRPSVFIGSSSEGLEFARAIRGLLRDDAEVTLWNEDFVPLGRTLVETLIDAAGRFDFAVLVLTPDDLVSSRDVEGFGPRDNVIFELGMFMGALGRDRTFVVRADSDVKVPSDLAGVTLASIEWPRADGSPTAAVGAACARVRPIVRQRGFAASKVGAEIAQITSRQNRYEGKLSDHEAQIRSLQMALRGIVTRWELEKLEGLNRDAPFLCRYTEDLADEVRHLRAMNFIHNRESVGLRTIMERYRDVEFDLRHFFAITDQGREYLELRRELDALSA